MVIELQRRVIGTEHQKKLHIIQGDVLKIELPFFTTVVANVRNYSFINAFSFSL
jgi:16S rRNA A1518/A1519 N6-dimethyltransferase RsmA/KsgA/DIM1 with predicted DNA glycosylase/AP lyase activity